MLDNVLLLVLMMTMLLMLMQLLGVGNINFFFD
jgi:hypothetical protein